MGVYENEKDQETVVAPPKGFRYNSPVTQVVLIGLVCFCCPGMFNALSGMGGGGQVNPEAANNANTALYTTFAVFGILGGGIYNLLGPHLTLFAGCSTYVLYAGSFLYYNHYQHQLFAIIAGGILGIGAGLLWAAQGAIMTSYPTEDNKGKYISLFWSIFNLGGVIGGFIPFISNYDKKVAGNVNDATYIAFMCFMSLGTLLTLTLLPSYKVIRNDGSRVSLMKYSNPVTEGVEILKLFANWKMLLLFPASWASNFFYTYQFNNVNSRLFTVRTKGFNNVFYWGAQMLGSVALGFLLDNCSKSRKKRGYIGVGIVALFTTVTWGGGLANQLKYNGKKPDLDFKDSGPSFAGPFVLYFCYGLLDAIFQTSVYWMIGALADDPQTLSRYSGFYKGVQSAGAAVAWQVDAHHTSPVVELIINWVLTTVSYPFLVVLVALAIHDKPTSAADSEANIGDAHGGANGSSVQPKLEESLQPNQ